MINKKKKKKNIKSLHKKVIKLLKHICLTICLIIFIYISFIRRERWFIIYNNEAWRISDLFLNLKEYQQQSIKSLQHYINEIHIVSYKPLTNRRNKLTTSLINHNITHTKYIFHYKWHRDDIINFKQNISQIIFSNAINELKYPNGYINYYTMGTRKQRSFEDHSIKNVKITKRILGSIANFMEHYDIWLYLLSHQTYENLLILEDDSTLVPYFKLKFNHVMEQVEQYLSNQYDIIYIGSCLDKSPFNKSWTSKISQNLYLAPGHRCASGYIISKQAIQKIIQHIKKNGPPPAYRAVDSWLEYYMNTLITNIYWVEPPLIFEGTKALNPSFYSIGSGGHWDIIPPKVINKNYTNVQ